MGFWHFARPRPSSQKANLAFWKEVGREGGGGERGRAGEGGGPPPLQIAFLGLGQNQICILVFRISLPKMGFLEGSGGPKRGKGEGKGGRGRGERGGGRGGGGEGEGGGRGEGGGGRSQGPKIKFAIWFFASASLKWAFGILPGPVQAPKSQFGFLEGSGAGGGRGGAGEGGEGRGPPPLQIAFLGLGQKSNLHSGFSHQPP